MQPTTKPSKTATAKAQQELLFKGVTCTLIGLVVLLAPYLARSPNVQEMMAQSSVVGWFALVLGGVFLVQYCIRQLAIAKARRQP